MITIIDYGMGNLGSIANMIKKVGGSSLITSKINEIEKAKKIILPGVGTFANGMGNLNKLGLIAILNIKVIKEKIPILGICLGMQLMSKESEEGKPTAGLGWIEGEAIKFKFKDNNLKIPHMGWNTVMFLKKSRLFKKMYPNPRFYFVHSYHLQCKDKQDVLTKTHYGYNFVSSIEKGNIYGVQFHPEKSHKFGIKLFENFIRI